MLSDFGGKVIKGHAAPTWLCLEVLTLGTQTLCSVRGVGLWRGPPGKEPRFLALSTGQTPGRPPALTGSCTRESCVLGAAPPALSQAN